MNNRYLILALFAIVLTLNSCSKSKTSKEQTLFEGKIISERKVNVESKKNKCTKLLIRQNSLYIFMQLSL